MRVSAQDAPAVFDLRCHMREQLLAFLRDEYPQSLPQTRVQVTSPPAPLLKQERGDVNDLP